tara:strand:+ start:1006 stop:1440 length:435 start_codon:yes stop_codon:yes gene_type:complete
MDTKIENVNNILRGTYENNLLNDIFFSDVNINLLQNQIIKNVKDKKNYIISKQSKKDLIVIMRNVYLNNAKHNYKTKEELKKEIKNLNKNSVKHCVGIIIKNIDNYIFYLNDINTPNYLKEIKPIDKPIDSRDYNTFEFNKPPH